jgi:hypothetical protein
MPVTPSAAGMHLVAPLVLGEASEVSRVRSQLAGLALLLLAASACSTAGDDDQGATSPYAVEIRQAANDARSDYERQVMADGDITRREYDETVQRAVDCASKQGVDVTVTSSYGLNTYAVPHDGSGAWDQCSETYLGVIESLYTSTVVNPRKVDIYDLTAECYRKSGLADSSFTGEKLRSIITGGGVSGTGDVTNSFPFDTSDPRYLACTSNPAQVPDGG